MRIPWMSIDVYRELSPRAVKMLCLIAFRSTRGGKLSARLVDLAPQAAMSEASGRRAIRELGEAGLLWYESTTQGYHLHIPYTKRFTFVPPDRANMLMALTATAVKVFVAVCRALKPSGMIRMLIDTMADRVGKSRRTVQLALAQIKHNGLWWTIRTGRSSVLIVEKDQHLFRPEIAHRSRLLLRLLLSTPRNTLTTTLGRLHKPNIEYDVRDAHPKITTRSDERWISKSLKALGVSRDEREVMLDMYTLDELSHACALLFGRHVADACVAIKMAVGRGWCAWSIQK